MEAKLRIGRTLAYSAVLLIVCCTASAKEAPDQGSRETEGNAQPLGGGKPVTTTIIKRCPNGRELIVRANGAFGCAKDIVPPND